MDRADAAGDSHTTALAGPGRTGGGAVTLEQRQQLGPRPGDQPQKIPGEAILVSVAEAAGLLGVSDDLVYELTERGQLPCLRFGRRKMIPRRAIALLVEEALSCFDPRSAVAAMRTGGGAVPDSPDGEGWRRHIGRSA